MKEPLWQKMYVNPLYTELVRVVGYVGISLAEAREKIQPLGVQYGPKAVQAAANEITHMDEKQTRLWLTDEARKMAFQLLGPPPEHPEFKKNQAEEAQP